MVYCFSLGDKQSIKAHSDSLWEHLPEMEAKCSELLCRLKLPTNPQPLPSPSTLGGVKSTLDEGLQPNSAWFEDPALLRLPHHAGQTPPTPTPVSSPLPSHSTSVIHLRVAHQKFPFFPTQERK